MQTEATRAEVILREAVRATGLSDCPIRGARVRIMLHENAILPERRHRRAVGSDRTPHPRLPRRSAAQDRPARRRRCRLLHPADWLPVALPAQGLPAQIDRLALLR